jgi:hypothetical protein
VFAVRGSIRTVTLRGEVVRFQHSISIIRVLGEFRKWGKSQECHQMWCPSANAYPHQGMTVKENMPQVSTRYIWQNPPAWNTMECLAGYMKDMPTTANVHPLVDIRHRSINARVLLCSAESPST